MFSKCIRIKQNFRNEPSHDFSNKPFFSPKSMSNPTLGHPNIEVFGQQYLHNVSFNEMMLRDSQRYQFQMKHFNSFCKTVRSNSSNPVFIEASTPSPPPQKKQHYPLFLAPLKSANCPNHPFQANPPIYLFFMNPPLP